MRRYEYVNRAAYVPPVGETKSVPPGVETVWKGLQRTRDFAEVWNAFEPGAARK
ncbi:MAG: hypothetical protein FWH27_01405 [Planctomycetaceae bacterium]|nr:hypothetical protein [Planctomycetaceae bacterium]